MNRLFTKPVLIFDGACGTSIQRMHLPQSVWGGYEGCNEYLNLSSPETIIEIHRQFLAAGADIIETNTFGASSIVLSEYNLEDKVIAINTAAVRNAKAAIQDFPDAGIAGSIGPTTKLPTLGQVPIEKLADSYRVQMRTLVEQGVDLFLIETVQDLLQLKTAVIAAQEVFAETGKTLPIMASITVEKTGTMLVGTEVAAVVAALEPYGLFSIGLNCATGPDLMASHLHVLSASTKSRVSCIPNAGMPETRGDKTVYPLLPEQFASSIAAYVRDLGVSVVGGCCGTMPEHIRCLAEAVRTMMPGPRNPEVKPSISSAYQAVEIRQEIPPLLVGERTNVNGSKKFREFILADDFDGALSVGLQQQESGAHAADLCTAYAGRNEKTDLTTMVSLFARSIKVPLVIDSTIPEYIESALQHYPGRAIINSINLEDGGTNLDKICRMAKKYGAAVIALTINENGMAMTTAEKIAVARRIYERAVGTHGLAPSDLFFDVLTFTIGSGDATLVNAAVESLNAIRQLKKELPGVFTILGVSNISFGLSAHSRKYLNSVFLHEAVDAGLDAAIVDPSKIIPLARLDAKDRLVCMNLVYNRHDEAGPSPLEVFIARFDANEKQNAGTVNDTEETVPEVVLTNKVIKGEKTGIDDVLAILRSRITPVAIINTILIPAMRKVGEMFGTGEMLLPFVLKSAETMRACVACLEPFMESKDDEAGTTILLATVAGDVHDIGKNLVDIILSNNGYKVVNIGIKVPAEVIIEKAKENNVDAIGLSGLLVKSALVMRDNMALFRDAGLSVPVLLGGAALTRAFVAESCVPAYDGPVVYCADAFAGLHALQEHENGTLRATCVEKSGPKPAVKPGRKDMTIDHSVPVPAPPFIGSKQVTDIDLEKLFGYINVQALFRGRWGYRRGSMSAEAYADMIDTTVKPLYASLKRKLVDDRLVHPAVVYGYFPCHADGDLLRISHEGTTCELSFPRQKDPPHLCIADFFRTHDEGDDVVGFFVVSIGSAISEATRKLYAANEYHEYLMLHALGVELTDALAEYWHEIMRIELGIGAQKPSGIHGYAVQEYQGSRYGFGYPACPDLDAHTTLFALLKPETIGVTLTENMQMAPEQTTSALIAHHPQAKYFAV